MAVIHLVRHAQAEDAGAGGHDHARPLDAAGQAAAKRLGQALKARGVEPDVVLCSSARRARETWEAMATELSRAAVAEIEETLYLATANRLRERLAALPQSCAAPLLVGHNPGLYELARLLAGEGAPQALAALKAGMPPGAAAALEVDGRWARLRAGCGRLVWLVVPERAA